jgi:hypothetical protein
VVDDIANYNFFKADVLAAPEEDVLEKFYTVRALCYDPYLLFLIEGRH